MDIGTSIKELRKKKKITQKELAEMCNISTNSICSIEKGITFPSKNIISRICKALNIPESYLLLFSLREDDIPDDKKIIYRTLCEPLKEELLRDL